MGWLFLLILLFMIFLWVYYANNNCVMPIKQFRYWWTFFSVIVALLALSFEPKSFIDWDLIRLFQHIDNIRTMGLENALALTEYRNLYIIKYWMYFVSLTEIDGLFQSVPLFIDFLIFGYIVSDIYKKRCDSLNCRITLLVAFVWISLMGIKLAISDVRCTWAMGLCCLAFYKEFICEERKLWTYVLYIVAVFIHHFTILFLIYRGLLLFRKLIQHRWLILIGALVSQVIIYQVATLLYNNVTNDYIKTMARKLLADWELYGFSNYFVNREVSMQFLYLAFVIVFIFGYIWATRFRNNFSNDSNYSYGLSFYCELYWTLLFMR